MRRSGKSVKVISWLLICLLFIAAFVPFTVNAAETKKNTIRVAYAISPGYQEGGKGEYKTGYGYEYLQKLATVTGWKYEYVYGSFNELLEKLEKGEVDLMGDLTYTDERAESILYGSYEEGKESSYLYVKKNSNSIDPQNYSSMNGKRIGVCSGQVQEKELMDWCEGENVHCRIISYDYFNDCKNALNNGDVDAIIESGIQMDDVTADWDVVMKLEAAPFYFGVSRNRPDILKELNRAQGEILEENPFFNEKIQERYLEPVSLATTNLNVAEKKWLKDNNKTVKFGFLEGFPPLCYEDDNGECKGVAADVFSSIEEKYSSEGIKFEAVKYSDYRTMFNDLKKGKISVGWPAYDDYWNAEKRGFLISDRVVDTSMMLVYNGQYKDTTISKIGVINTGSLPKIYADIHYPDSKVIEYNSYEDAINAILRGEVSSVLYVSTTYNVHVTNNDLLQRMNMVVLPDDFGISFAVSQDEEELRSILDKGIAAFGEAGVNHSLVVNTTTDKKITLKDYFEQHPYIGVGIVVLFLSIIAGIVIFVIYKNMSLRIKTSQAEKKVFEHLSNSDTLTGLYNRKMVFRRSRELLSAHPEDQFVMVHVDMKHFRLFNTYFGDEAGDQLLCDVADIFREMSKDYEYWAYGRIEADVFCLFFPYDEEKYRKHYAYAIDYLRNYRSDFLIEPAIGVYYVTDPDMSMEAMFTRATMAAKEVQTGTPYATVVYDDLMETELNNKQQIINDMQTAIDSEQFEVYLQPKYSLINNKMTGAEALVRWKHPAKGMISPGEFIPVFESNGFITTLDRYMWEHVCQLLSRWKSEGEMTIPISVNVSRISMFSKNTVEYLKQLVKKYDIAPGLLELELTESAYIDDPDEMKIQMIALREAGFTVLLDDFGSGYSSLNTLRELPVDILKLDMKFLSMGENDLRGGLVLSSIVRMGKLLNLPVIAEGVELPEQADYLKSIGCEYVQGFLYARPMPVSEFEKLMEEAGTHLSQVNQTEITHIGRIIAETGTGTYSMGTVIPAPLACVDFINRQFSFLRVNPDFYTEFNISEELESMSETFRKHLSEKSISDLISAFDESVRAEKKVRVPIIWTTDDGEQRNYICSVAYEGKIGKTATLVVAFANVTDLLNKGKDEAQASFSKEYEGGLWNCVKKLVSASDINAATNSILQEVMAYYDADRAYIFEFDWDKKICSNTYEVCAPEVESVINTLQEVPIAAIDTWIRLFNEKTMIHIESLEELLGDEHRKDEYDILEPQGIQSLVAVPVYSESLLVGFLGVDNPRCKLEDTSFIESLAFFCINESIREKEKTNLEKMSMLDSLTGAYNRKAWEQKQKELTRDRTPFSVLMIDVDDYKLVNDRFGHKVGDELLKRIVAVLKELFRENDMIVRYGGDEFIIILENTGSWMEDILTRKIDKLNGILSQPEEGVPGVTVSVGIAFSDDSNGDELYRNADRAMYQVKKSGKKGWHIFNDKDE